MHLICVTQYHRNVFDDDALAWLQERARQVFAKMSCRMLAGDAGADHLHWLVQYPTKLSVSVMINARLLARHAHPLPFGQSPVIGMPRRAAEIRLLLGRRVKRDGMPTDHR